MATGGWALAAALGRSLAWGIGTGVVSFAVALGVFVVVLPRFLETPGLFAPTFAILTGHGGLFIGLLLALVLEGSRVARLGPWQRGLHGAAVLLVAGLAWSTVDVPFAFDRSVREAEIPSALGDRWAGRGLAAPEPGP